jgi:SAM-dependent methyltransferase
VWPAAEGYWLRGGRRALHGVRVLLRHVPWWFVRRTVRRWRRDARRAVAAAASLRSVRESRRLSARESVAPRPAAPPAGHVDLGALRRVQPIDRDFGFGRGWPVDRYYIDAFLERHAGDVRGRVLEVKDSAYTRRFGSDRVTRGDVLDVDAANPMATVVADLENGAGLPDGAFDCVILTQTLHLIYDLRAALRALHRSLAPGGVLLLTVPGITKVDAGIPWYWSFTAASARRLLQEVFPPEGVHVEAFGNVLAAVAFLEGLAVDELSPEELDVRDAEYPVCITVRAVKPAATPHS